MRDWDNRTVLFWDYQKNKMVGVKTVIVSSTPTYLVDICCNKFPFQDSLRPDTSSRWGWQSAPTWELTGTVRQIRHCWWDHILLRFFSSVWKYKKCDLFGLKCSKEQLTANSSRTLGAPILLSLQAFDLPTLERSPSEAKYLWARWLSLK